MFYVFTHSVYLNVDVITKTLRLNHILFLNINIANSINKEE